MIEKIVNEYRVKKHGSYNDEDGDVLYYMQRDQRIHDNWALLYAQQKALELKRPLIILVSIDDDLKWYPKTLRHYDFMMQGLQEIEIECHKLQIAFEVIVGDPEKLVVDYIKKNKIGVFVTDFNPLKYYQKNIKIISQHAHCSVYEVDAHNIVPCWITSQKQEYAARTIRPKIKKLLFSYLIDFPKLHKHLFISKKKYVPINWKLISQKINFNNNVSPLDWIKPGQKAAYKALENFIKVNLNKYNDLRNDPVYDVQSNLSPYLHFGHISAQRIALEIKNAKFSDSVKESFLEELIVRKELSDNYCYYNSNYDSLDGAPVWAQETLKKHSNDSREYIYTKKQFENAETHDDLWNAAQLQLLYHGKIHGYMRMYWAKKILEWSKTPEYAFSTALYLNDTYSIDGTDPNGYVGVAWSIAGVHDRAWFPRKIFGTIRYMSYNGCKGKFDVEMYIKNVQKNI